MKEGAGPGVIRDLPGQGVIVEGFTHDPSDIGQLDQLGERAPNRKTGKGLPLTLAGLLMKRPDSIVTKRESPQREVCLGRWFG